LHSPLPNTYRLFGHLISCWLLSPTFLFPLAFSLVVDFSALAPNDLRELPLIERKRQLRKLLGRRRSRILYLDHVENDGKLLFEQIVKMNLEGMVCKRKNSPYRVTEKPSPYWIKVKNLRYSQLEGREELFER
jgi:ATP-dependent DNA ligase